MTSQDRISAANTLFHSRWKELGEENLYPFEHTYIALFWLFGNVFNGGFEMYFLESSGDLAPLALDGLRQIGAKNTEFILKDALDAFGEDGYTTDRNLRRDKLDALPDPQFDVLNRKFYEFSDAASALALEWLAGEYDRIGLTDS